MAEGLKARQVRVKTFEDTTVGGLDTAIATFLATLAESTYLALTFAAHNGGSGTYAAQLTYLDS